MDARWGGSRRWKLEWEGVSRFAGMVRREKKIR
jgi:hypothetical protein